MPASTPSYDEIVATLTAPGQPFAVVRTDDSALMVSLRSLPSRPTVITLKPRYLIEP